MKICAIGLRGIPEIMGGIESHCQQLYPRLVKQGVSVSVLARSPYVDQKRYDYEGVEVRSVWAMKSKFLETFLHTFIAIFYARLWIKPDVVHLHAIGPALFTPLARALGMKVIVTHHGADYDRQKWNAIAKFILKLGEKMAILFANELIVVGNSLTDKLKLENPSKAFKISYIPNGMLPGFAGDIPESKLPTDLGLDKKSYILTVGRLVPEKGFHDLIDAFNKVNTNLRLVIVGKADHQDSYSSGLLQQASDKVLFAGRRSGSELHALYKHAKVFVLPSYHEGLPIVALEAISAGTSVLLSNISPNLDIEAPEDSYFAVGNIEQLSKKLEIIDTLNLQLDQASFLNKFNWDKIANATYRIILKYKYKSEV